MEISIKWTFFASNELNKVFVYYRNKFSLRTARHVISSIHQDVNRLKKQPKLGKIDEQLLNREQEFRFLISKHVKIVYWINHEKNWIEIIDIFDSRQNPTMIGKER